MEKAEPTRRPALAWDGQAAALAAACVLPAAVVALGDVPRGAALAIGVLPAALVGVAPTRRRRLVVVLMGVLIGLPLFLGGVLSGVPVLAVAALLGLGVATAELARRSRLGVIAMTVSLPLLGVGLSYPDVGKAASAAVLLILGSVVACAVSMLWPERPPEAAQPGPQPTIGYGVRLGLAGATAAAIGFALGLEHVGWATAAALLVMRPSEEMQRVRSVGRVVAVILGATVAAVLVHLHPPAFVFSLAVIAVLTAAAGTHHSRWYVTSAFTTFLVFLLLLYPDPGDAGARFGERVGETLLGVGLAYLYGLALPALVSRWRSRG